MDDETKTEVVTRTRFILGRRRQVYLSVRDGEVSETRHDTVIVANAKTKLAERDDEAQHPHPD